MSKAKFTAARELIREENYHEARLILRSMPDHPTAQKWLARLDEIAPEPEPQLQPDVHAQIQSALDERDRQQRRRQWVGCALRGCLPLLFILCSCIFTAPLLIRQATELELPGAQALSNSFDSFSESFVGEAIDGVTNQIVNTGVSQMAPVMEQQCSQIPDPQGQAMCRQSVDDVVDCIIAGGDFQTCMRQVGTAFCADTADPQAQQACMDQLNTLLSGSGF